MNVDRYSTHVTIPILNSARSYIKLIVLTALVFAITLSGCATRGTVREIEDSLADSEREREEAAARIEELESELVELRQESRRVAERIGTLGIRVPEALETIDRIATALRHHRPERLSSRPAAPRTEYDTPPRPAEARPPLRHIEDSPEPTEEPTEPPPDTLPLREVSARGGHHEPRPPPPYHRTERVLAPRPTVDREISRDRHTIAESLNGRLRMYDDRRNPWSGDTLYPYVEKLFDSVDPTEDREDGERTLFLAVDITRSTEHPPFDMRVLQLEIGDSVRRFAIDDDAVQRKEDYAERRETVRIPATDSVLATIDSILRGKRATLTIEGSFERKEIRIAASERRALEAMHAFYHAGITP